MSKIESHEITFVYGRPPFWRILKYFFPAYDPDGTVSVAFGRRIYANDDIPIDFEVHEMQHLKQQGHSYIGAIVWWIRYVRSKDFRYAQELDAYQTQFRWIKDQRPQMMKQRLEMFSRDLSGKLYGNLVTKDEAMKQISKVIYA